MSSISGVRGFKDLWRRLFFVFCAMVVCRTGSFVPVPGLNVDVLATLFEQHKQVMLVELMNLFSGGSLARASVFALGIGPYITASIAIQILSLGMGPLADLQKEGSAGRRRLNHYTRLGALVVAFGQAIGASILLASFHPALVLYPGIGFYVLATTSLVAGSLLLMWIGEQISEHGIGNGSSLIIFFGIVSGLPGALARGIEQIRCAQFDFISSWTYLSRLVPFVVLIGVALLFFWVVYGVVLMEKGQRRVTVCYANRQVGQRMLALPATHLPLKLNMVGVMPAIFALTLLQVTTMASQWITSLPYCSSLRWITGMLARGFSPLYLLCFCAGIFFCTFFYTDLMFNPKETAENLKKAGAFVPGIRPGAQTASYIQKVMSRLTFLGSLYILIVCLLPDAFTALLRMQFSFGGTSLMIVVGVIMDFIDKIKGYIISRQYNTGLQKATFRGFHV